MENKVGSNNMTMLYPYLCYNEECYKGTALYYVTCFRQLINTSLL